jgi:PIN domain nuclease of toxin-antitoxin system
LKALLDTHTFIWMDTDPTRLSPAVQACFADPLCEIHLSVVSVWEVIIKTMNSKLALTGDVQQMIRDIQARNPLRILPVMLDHVLALRSLPPIHRDPFDRMLVAQAVVENAVLLSCDANIKQYPVRVIW